MDIIIPTRNRPHLTAEAVRAVQSQTYQDWHLHVVDDASTDDTLEHLRGLVGDDGRVSLLALDRRGGGNPARQRAFERSAAPLVAICDSDDLWAPDKLARQVAAWDGAGSDPGLLLCWHDVIDGEGRHVARAQPPHRGRRWNPFTAFNTSTPLLSRRLITEVGGFAPTTPYPWVTTDHMELFLRLTRSITPRTIPEVLVHCRHHAGPRNSDAERTRDAAVEAATLLGAASDQVAGSRRTTAWLEAWVAGRYLEVGDLRSARPHATAALRAAGPFTGSRLLAHYGPWALRQLVRQRGAA